MNSGRGAIQGGAWRTLWRGAAILLLLPLACAAPPARADTDTQPPEGPSGYSAKPGWHTRHNAVAAAHPLAVAAGLEMLRAGGTAVDAAVAVQMVLGLVEPQSSGIGGGAFLLHDDGQRVQAWDGRETAPAAADENLFLGADGQPMALRAAVVGGRAVGVPGAVRMLEAAHRQHGRLPWASLFQPAIRLAEEGFPVSPRLHRLLASDPYLRQDPQAAALFYDAAGQPLAVGALLKNPEYAAVLRILARTGSQGLHEGEVARAIVATVQSHASNPGRLSLADLGSYQARLRTALCFDHTVPAQPGRARHDYRLCGMPPPSSGSLAIGQILGLLDHSGADAWQARPDTPPPAEWLHAYLEATRLAFADRAQYVGDPDFVTPPGAGWSSLLDQAYLGARAGLLGPGRMQTAPAGVPPGSSAAYAPAPEQPEHGTSHISIVDGLGHALAMTTTIEDGFGARLLVNRGRGLAGGFLLNNQLTDFSFVPTGADGRPVANRVQPGKRPRSSMSPTLVFERDSGALLMAAGSPGGTLIIHFTTKALYGLLHGGLDPQQAVSLPNFAWIDDTVLLEQGRFPAATLQALRARGHRVREAPLTSGLQVLQKTPQGWAGGADPRREGVVMGD